MVPATRSAKPPLSPRQKRGALLAGVAMGAIASLFGLVLGAAVLITGFVMDVATTVQDATPPLIAVAFVLSAAAWFASWGVLRRHDVAHPVSVTSWSLAIAVIVSLVSAVLSGCLAFVFGALSFVFVESAEALGPIVVVAAVAIALPTLLAGFLAVTGLSRAHRPATPSDSVASAADSGTRPGASQTDFAPCPPEPGLPPVRI